MIHVLLYSGGMDSVIASHLLEPHINLYVDVGSRYAAKEIHNVLQYPPKHGALIFSPKLNLGEFERDADLILPQRNAYLVLMAAHYGERIYMAANAGDRSTDKDERFAERITDLLSHVWQPQYWLPEGRSPSLHLPYRGMTKGQMIQTYLHAGGDPQRLVRSISCYDPIEEQCGRCRSCARKWVALESFGIPCEHVFSAHPGRAYYTPEVIEGIESGRLPGEEGTLDLLKAKGFVG